MSKNILGQTFGNVSLDLTTSNISADKLTGTTEINGTYLTANRGLTTDSNKKLVSTTATATEINHLSGVSSNIQTQLGDKHPTIDSSARLNANLISDGSVSNAEFNTLDGIDTSQTIKTQLDLKLSSATATTVYFTNIAAQDKQDEIDSSNRLNANLIGANGNVSNTEYGHLNGVSSNIQTQLNNSTRPQAGTNLTYDNTTDPPTLNASITTPTITADRVCVSDSGGNLTQSGITTTELNRLNNISQNIQTTLNTKLNNSSLEFNSDNAEGQARLRINSSTSDFSSSEGTSLSKFIIRSRHHRNAGGTLVNTQNTNVFGVFSFRQADSNGDNQRCDLRNGQFRSNSTEYLSDDRLKWDEQPITNGLNTIMKLKPQVYTKYTEYNVEDPSIRPTDIGSGVQEFGFIAQEVAEIEELSFLVGSDKNYLQEDMPIFALNYNGIYVLAVQAIQELKTELDDVKQRLSYLENKTN